MKKYTNNKTTVKILVLEDDSAIFLKCGESVLLDKRVKVLPEGVSVIEVVVEKKQKKE